MSHIMTLPRRLNDCGLPLYHLSQTGPSVSLLNVPKAIELYRVTTVIDRKTVIQAAAVRDKIQTYYISRVHAQIFRTGGNHILQDCSLNGTFINHVKIAGSVILQEGDLVTFGNPHGSSIPAGTVEQQSDWKYQFLFGKCDCPQDGAVESNIQAHVHQEMDGQMNQNAVNRLAEAILTQCQSVTNSSSNLDESLRQYIATSLKQHSERLVDMIGEQLQSNKSRDQIKTYLSHMDDYLNQSYRQRRVELTDGHDNDEDYNQGGSDVHVRAIRTLSQMLTKNVRVEGTTVLDNLVQQDALSEAGRSSILARPTKHGKNTAFWKHCSGYSTSKFKRIVIPALKKSNDEVNANLARDLEEEIANSTQRCQNFSLCTFCKIQNKVNFRQLSDKLYELGAVSEHVRDDLASSLLSNAEKWKTLLQKVKKSTLAKAMKKRYPSLYMKLRLTPHMALICTCNDNDTCTETSDPLSNDNLSDIARLSDISSESGLACQTMHVD